MTQGRTTIIAEVGVNHNGSLELALALVDAAAHAGADVVKFQTFKADHVASASCVKADYQMRSTDSTESQLDMLRRLELSEDAHCAVMARCRERKVRFLSSPFDLVSLAVLVDRFKLEEVKFGSGELTNAPLLLAAARAEVRIVLSTGMSTLGDVEKALGVLAFGYCGGSRSPNRDAFEDSYATAAAHVMLRNKVVLLHCTTEYPASFSETNLRAIDCLRQAFDVPVGLSDHTPGIEVSIAATARGAVAIEKHLTLDRAMKGPDHRASLEPDEFARMVSAIRNIEIALGDGIKRPSLSERNNITITRKSLVAARDIAAGELFSEENMTVKRPGSGVSPYLYWDRLGQRASRSYKADELI